jgi:truncated hemoglobin YjbI
MRHARFRVDLSARNRWVMLMEQALAETQLPANATAMLHQFFIDSATFLINQPD